MSHLRDPRPRRHRRLFSRICRFLTALLLAVTYLIPARPALALDALRWQWIDPLPTGFGLYKVIYANNQFVAVGEADTVLTSPDGLQWTVQRSGPGDYDIRDVAWGNGIYVAIARYLERGPHPSGIGDTLFERYLPLTSRDGVSWVAHYEKRGFASGHPGLHPLDSTCARLAFDGRQFVLEVNDTFGYHFWVSADGVNWKPDPAYAREDFPLYHPTAPGPVAEGNNGQFVSIDVDHGHVYTSPDGYRWYFRTRDIPARSVAFGAGRFVVVGIRGPLTESRRAYIATSTDGVDWTPQGSSLSPLGETRYTSVAHGNGVTVVGGQKKMVILSQDLRPTVIPVDMDVADVEFVNGRFVAALSLVNNWKCSGSIRTSVDGKDWTEVLAIKGCPQKIMRIGTELAVWSPNVLFRSSDLTNWNFQEISPPRGGSIQDLTWADGQFAAILNGSSFVYLSSDGKTWTAHNPNLGSELFESLNFVNGLFIVGGAMKMGTSRDGMTWDAHSLEPSSASIRNLRYMDGRYVAVGGGRVAFSVDGRNWHMENLNRAVDLHDIVSTGTHYILVGDSRILAAKIPACRPYFSDLSESHPVCKPAEMLYQHGVITGYADRSFRPDRPVTRAEIAKMVTVAMGQYPKPLLRVTFTDVAGHWSVTQGYLQAAVEMGVISGYNAQTFGPDDPLTRAQLIKVTAAALGLTPQGTHSYSGVPAWADGWVAAAQQAGLIGSRAPFSIWTDGNLNGDAPVTRGEAATLLANMLKLKK